jgi:rSAM/selenodomain-associated transferase 1
MSFPNQGEKKDRLLGIFAKEPVAGKVKTRLVPPLSAGEAAELYNISLRETVARMTEAGFCPAIFFSGRRSFFQRNFSGLPLFPQGEGDLGERMERAFGRQLKRGFRKMVIIGTDSPDLPPGIIKKAFASLDTEEVVVSPARDGGYVLIGESCHHPELFFGIPWSTGEVLAMTRHRARQKGLRYLELEGWEDIDDAASLERFLQRTPASPVSIFVRQKLKIPVK